MPSPYQEFVRKAKERFAENQKNKLQPKGGVEFTAHARYKMSQYGLSEQKVKGVIRNPKRTETGIAPKTVAVMQPVSAKVINGKSVWKQEVWVMFVRKGLGSRVQGSEKTALSLNRSTPSSIRIISTWRYPGVSPKRSPVPEEIWQELADGSILEVV